MHFVFHKKQLLTSSLNIVSSNEPFNGIEYGVFGLIILKLKLFNSYQRLFYIVAFVEITLGVV